MDTDSLIYVAGHTGLAGSAIVRQLRKEGFSNLIVRSHRELDLCDRRAVDTFFGSQHPEYVFLAAALVGGILANSSRPADFLFQNLALQTNVIDAAWRFGVHKLLFLGSSCIYPKLAPQPLKEEYLLTGPLEETNEAYAIAKIAGIKMAQAYRKQFGFSTVCLMPTNLYGPGDRFDYHDSHVLPALLRKFHEAVLTGQREVVVWGSGCPRREFLHVDDLASASVHLMRSYDDAGIVNVGRGEDLPIEELAKKIAHVTGFRGTVLFDTSKPDGTPRKLLDVSRIHALGWRASIDLNDGLASTYQWYRQIAANSVSPKDDKFFEEDSRVVHAAQIHGNQ